MLVLNKNILTIGGNRLEGGPLIPPEPPGPSFDEVTIGTQTWMAKNLSIDDDGSGITIKDNVTANGVNFGTQYYYTWDAAKRVANSISGWHLPSQTEWETLLSYIGTSTASKQLKSTSGWNNNGNGTDYYGFTILPVGVFNSSVGTMPALTGETGTFLSSDKDPITWVVQAWYDWDQFDNTAWSYDNTLHCVRLIKDT